MDAAADPGARRLRLSFVTSLYRSEQALPELCRLCAQAADEMGMDLEMVLVNDASPDNSLAVARELARQDSRIVVLDLSRNYGQHKAVRTALANATGDLIASIDSDLEDDPLWIPRFWGKMKETGADVVYGMRTARKGNWFYRQGHKAFNSMLTMLIGKHLPRRATSARLMTRRYLDAFLSYGETDFYLLGLYHDCGYRQEPFPVKETVVSETSYSPMKLMAIVVRGVTSFSVIPLAMIFVFGFVLSLCAMAFIFYLLVMTVFTDAAVSGWASLMAAVLLLGGVTLMFNGVMAMYISTIYLEVKQRPVIVRERFGGAGEAAQ